MVTWNTEETRGEILSGRCGRISSTGPEVTIALPAGDTFAILIIDRSNNVIARAPDV